LSTLLERFITHFSRDPFTYTTHPALFSTVLFALPAPSLPAAGLPSVGFAILAELALQSSFMLFVPAGVRATTLGAALYYFFNAFFVAAGVEEFAKVWAMRCQKAICSSSCCFRLCNWNSDPNAKCCGRAAARFFCAARFTPGRARDGCCLGTSLRQPRAFVIYTMVAAMGFSTTENFEVRVDSLRVCVTLFASSFEDELSMTSHTHTHSLSSLVSPVSSNATHRYQCYVSRSSHFRCAARTLYLCSMWLRAFRKYAAQATSFRRRAMQPM